MSEKIGYENAVRNEVLSKMLPQLLVALVKREGGVLTMPIPEIDDTGDVILMMELDEAKQEFIFRTEKKTMSSNKPKRPKKGLTSNNKKIYARQGIEQFIKKVNEAPLPIRAGWALAFLLGKAKAYQKTEAQEARDEQS